MPTASSSPTAIITGAGSGIGRAIALRLHREGWRLLLLGRTESKLQETEALCLKRGASDEGASSGIKLVTADVSDATSARQVVATALSHFGRLDALVNNAGRADVAPIDQTSADLLEKTFAVNVFGPAHLIAAAWPVFKRQKGGVVVNISSFASFDPFTGFFVYGASKAALDSLTRSTAGEGAEIGVKAYSVNPGAVETSMLRSAFSTEALPEHKALDPRTVAEVAWECIAGLREHDNGRAIPVMRR
jgi:NAD(P)-dependent dehydrogenase (short-subunit alcohol dehydrogenase family)